MLEYWTTLETGILRILDDTKTLDNIGITALECWTTLEHRLTLEYWTTRKLKCYATLGSLETLDIDTK
ncbi:hypothetical protein Glove_60g7 [Diversispora epigaea]|uniref:Uncharacterized protein n=1 Tax=Diversispora epigaea TaxID=1348612 RepID=A0A397JMP5_9GLOM|nr:hypothetical protein Glove_60g7 [Diversispora epigaea]